ncbi:hypothetical protein [Neptuniibacter sp.]|uniref:hypothetical protein n=1 Tax=Neptuniibacter sp. TaxID=1962643 RepID=UPI00261766ED|nr:hypothetical protein [Neptuniibacter sp.]MCP4594980.1 hypothetical protein [Neptuniibacter sp.]
MTFLIDAWLERSNPYLKVIHRSTGVPVVSWHGETLLKKFQSGSICAEDFEETPSQELIKELFLLDCLEQEV